MKVFLVKFYGYLDVGSEWNQVSVFTDKKKALKGFKEACRDAREMFCGFDEDQICQDKSKTSYSIFEKDCYGFNRANVELEESEVL